LRTGLLGHYLRRPLVPFTERPRFLITHLRDSVSWMVGTKNTSYPVRRSPHRSGRPDLVQEILLGSSQVIQKLDDTLLVARLAPHQQKSYLKQRCLPVVLMWSAPDRASTRTLKLSVQKSTRGGAFTSRHQYKSATFRFPELTNVRDTV